MNWNTLTQAIRDRLKEEGHDKEKFNALSSEQKTKIVNRMKSATEGVRKRTENTEPSRMGLPSEEDLGTISDVMTSLARETDATEKALRGMAHSGQDFFNGNVAKGIAEVTKSLNTKVGMINLGAQSFTALNEKVTAFAYLSEDAFNNSGRLSAALAEQAGHLKLLGMNYSSFAKNTDMAIHSLQLNEEGVKKFNLSIKTLADDLKMLPNEVSRNFQAVSKNLMYDAATIQSQFVKFQVLAQKTGLEADQIANRFGSGMDTISGASGAAANINALLGRNAFSATELLGMEEADRAEAIRAAIQGDSQLMADIDAGGAQGKFAMISVAESLGMGRDEARRFIKTGEKGDSVKSKLEKEIGARTGVSGTPGDQNMSRVISSFTTGTSDLKEAMDKLTEQFMKTLDPSMAMAIQNRRITMEKAQRGEYSQLEGIGTFQRLGTMPDQLTKEQFNQAIRLSPGAQGLERLVKRGQAGLYDTSSQEFKQLVKGLTSDESSVREKASAQLDNILKTEPSMTQEGLRQIDGLDPTSMSVITRVAKFSEYGGRTMIKAYIDHFKNKRQSPEAAEKWAKEYQDSETATQAKKVQDAQDSMGRTMREGGTTDKSRSLIQKLKTDFNTAMGKDGPQFEDTFGRARASALTEAEKKRRRGNEKRNTLDDESGSARPTTDSSGNTIINFLLNDTILASAMVKGQHEVLSRVTE